MRAPPGHPDPAATPPFLTAAVLAVTATISVLGLHRPDQFALLWRDDPAISHGQLWRR